MMAYAVIYTSLICTFPHQVVQVEVQLSRSWYYLRLEVQVKALQVLLLLFSRCHSFYTPLPNPQIILRTRGDDPAITGWLNEDSILSPWKEPVTWPSPSSPLLFSYQLARPGPVAKFSFITSWTASYDLWKYGWMSLRQQEKLRKWDSIDFTVQGINLGPYVPVFCPEVRLALLCLLFSPFKKLFQFVYTLPGLD